MESAGTTNSGVVMKIGLIGNVNNNNFALMRYFRDLGADAHLFLYSNDGKGDSGHFRPEADTWEIERWAPYIHQTDIPNTPLAAVDFPLSWAWSTYSALRALSRTDQQYQAPVSRTQIRRAYRGCDRLVASGVSPATLARIGANLDVFYPYSLGVEYLQAPTFLRRSRQSFGFGWLTNAIISRRQARGIRSAKAVINFEMGVTHDILMGIGVAPHRLPVPMVYAKECPPHEPPTDALRTAAAALSTSDFSVLHQARLMWCRPNGLTDQEWELSNKNNDWLIRAFALLACQRPKLRCNLFLVEYGPDVAATKRLVSELKLEDHVHWLPLLERREIMWLLSRVSVGSGEFYCLDRTMWGGTGWEALASGRPLLQGFRFTPGEFEHIYGYPQPPILRVNSFSDVVCHLQTAAANPDRSNAIGAAAKAWFRIYGGQSIAEQWLKLIA